VKKYIHGKLSVVDVVDALSPFLIYMDDITFKQYEEITDETCKEKINTSYNYMYTLTGLAGAMIAFGTLDLYMGGLQLPTKNDHLLIVVGCLVVMFIASVSIDTSNRSVNEDPYKMLMVFFLIMAIIVVCIIAYLKFMNNKSGGSDISSGSSSDKSTEMVEMVERGKPIRISF
jgi:hypothetical protein